MSSWEQKKKKHKSKDNGKSKSSDKVQSTRLSETKPKKVLRQRAKGFQVALMNRNSNKTKGQV